MKQLLLLSLLIPLLATTKADAQQIEFSFTTVNLAGHKRSPKHVFALWVKKADGQFVNTLMVYASERIAYLQKFNASSGGFKVDAVTGATLLVHTAHQATWNLRDFLKATVPNGNYILCFEMSSGEDPSKNAYYEIPFTINGNNFNQTPADFSNLKSMTLSFSGGTNTAVQSLGAGMEMYVAPNPVQASSVLIIKGFEKAVYELEIYEMSGRKVMSRSIGVFSGREQVLLPAEVFQQPGAMFVLRLRNGNQSWLTSFIQLK